MEFRVRRGLGVKDAVACLTEARDEGSAWVARCDIDDCFEHIPRMFCVEPHAVIAVATGDRNRYTGDRRADHYHPTVKLTTLNF